MQPIGKVDLKLKFNFILSVFLFANCAMASCQIEIEDGVINFEVSDVLGTASEKLLISLPKEVNHWPLSAIEFRYYYGDHYINTHLAWVVRGSVYVSEIVYSKEFQRTVRVSIAYLQPGGE